MSIPRPEHPNPIFRRSTWLNLNGKWKFAIQKVTEEDCPKTWDGLIRVPFCLQSSLSGALRQLKEKRKLKSLQLTTAPLAAKLSKKSALWYQRALPPLPRQWRSEDMHIFLHIGACDSTAKVFVNGVSFPEHTGGSTALCLNITDALHDEANILTVRCTDSEGSGVIQPCGKQMYHKAYPASGKHVPTLYSNVTGIWQTVWLEAVNASAHLLSVQTTPVMPRRKSGPWLLELYPQLPRKASSKRLVFEAALFEDYSESAQKGRPLLTRRVAAASFMRFNAKKALRIRIPATRAHIWSPEDPHLYGLRLRLLTSNRTIDEVWSYAALRRVGSQASKKKSHLLLNGKPQYLRFVLDQGYYADGLWTAPTDQALKNDIVKSMELGFNGARLHQKVFEPRFFYHADRLGYMVIAEYPDWAGGKTCRWQTTKEYRSTLSQEWERIVPHLHNHPSIIAWGPFNEFGPKHGWQYNTGIGGGFRHHATPAKRKLIIEEHTEFVRNVVKRVKRLDRQDRPVQDASGWIHLSTDLWGIHEYCQRPEQFGVLLSDLPQKHVAGRKGEPLWVSEYGGVGIDDGGPQGRNPKRLLAGYNGSPGLPRNKDEALARIKNLTEQIYRNPSISGFCYTQLYDVEFEKNGLLRYDRSPKFSVAALRRIFDGSGQTGRWAQQ